MTQRHEICQMLNADHHQMENARNNEAEENLAPFFNAGEANNGQPPPQFECPICLHWLQDPVLTACGHRFCKGCIAAWLQQGKHCPVDNVVLRNVDIFPDNYTKREILQQCMICPNSGNGCEVRVGPLELEKHVTVCGYRKRVSLPSPKTSISCSFGSLGCKVPLKNEEQLSAHLESNTQSHLNLLMAAYNRLTIDKDINDACNNMKECEALALWSPPEKQTDSPTAESSSNGQIGSTLSPKALTRALYERIVILEQRNHEQDITIGNLSRLVTTLSNNQRQMMEDLNLKFCNGTYTWKIENFSAKLETVLKDPSKILYSQGFYTSPAGYRFCIRLNCSPIQANYLALHIHMMKSENDDCLDWPFVGKIALSLINPTFPQLTQKDTMEAKPELAAFQRPTTEMSTRGFGFASYISVDDIKLKGFILSDCLKLQIKIVKI